MFAELIYQDDTRKNLDLPASIQTRLDCPSVLIHEGTAFYMVNYTDESARYRQCRVIFLPEEKSAAPEIKFEEKLAETILLAAKIHEESYNYHMKGYEIDYFESCAKAVQEMGLDDRMKDLLNMLSPNYWNESLDWANNILKKD